MSDTPAGDQPEGQAPDLEAVTAKAGSLGIPSTRRHIFLCVGPRCCSPEQGQESWTLLKGRLKKLYPDLATAPVYRSKANCLRLCGHGPVGVVYPEGTWYAHMDPENLERVIEEHLVAGKEVTALRFGSCRLAAGPCTPASGDAADDS